MPGLRVLGPNNEQIAMECGNAFINYSRLYGAMNNELRNGTKVFARITRGLHFTVTDSFPEMHAEG